MLDPSHRTCPQSESYHPEGNFTWDVRVNVASGLSKVARENVDAGSGLPAACLHFDFARPDRHQNHYLMTNGLVGTFSS